MTTTSVDQTAEAPVTPDDDWPNGPVEFLRVLVVVTVLGSADVVTAETDSGRDGVGWLDLAGLAVVVTLYGMAVVLTVRDRTRFGRRIGQLLIGSQVAAAALFATLGSPSIILGLALVLALFAAAFGRLGERGTGRTASLAPLQLAAITIVVISLIWLPAIVAASAPVCDGPPRVAGAPGMGGCWAPGKGVDMARLIAGLALAPLGLLGLGALLTALKQRVLGRWLARLSAVVAAAGLVLVLVILTDVVVFPYAWDIT